MPPRPFVPGQLPLYAAAHQQRCGGAMRGVILLNGPIGVGKTTLGRALAEQLDGAFIDSDDLRDRSRTWLGEVLRGARRLVAAGMAALETAPVLVVAKPLRCQDWLYLKGAFAARGVPAWCVTLTADAERILDPARWRRFSEGERARIAEMLAQGYGARRFSDLIVATDAAGFAETAARLAASCRELLRR
jgi:hypothetical protein